MRILGLKPASEKPNICRNHQALPPASEKPNICGFHDDERWLHFLLLLFDKELNINLLQMLGFSEANVHFHGIYKCWASPKPWFFITAFLQMLGFSEADSNPKCSFLHKRLIFNPDNR